MTADEFVAAVEHIPPDREEFRRALRLKYGDEEQMQTIPGQSDSDAGDEPRLVVDASGMIDIVELFSRQFYFDPKPSSVDRIADDPLVDLVSRYHASAFATCSISFVDEAELIDEYVHVGFHEGALLVVDSSTGEVCVVDAARGELVLVARCARDGARFLDALVPLIVLHKRHVLQEIDMYDGTHSPEIVTKCTELAGGVRYQTFYRGIFAR